MGLGNKVWTGEWDWGDNGYAEDYFIGRYETSSGDFRDWWYDFETCTVIHAVKPSRYGTTFV